MSYSSLVETKGGGSKLSLFGVVFLVVFKKEVRAKVAIEIAPDSMDVVHVVLSVVVFEEPFWGLNPVVMSFSFVDAASPRKIHALTTEDFSARIDIIQNVGAILGDIFISEF